MRTWSSTNLASNPTARSKWLVKTWRSISRSSGARTWYSATFSNSCLLPWNSLRPRSLRSAANTSKIFTTWSRMCIPRRTLSCSSKKKSSATTTSTPLCGSMNPLYRHERPFSTSSAALSAQRRTMRTLSTCGKTFTARVSKITWRSTCWATFACWPTCSKRSGITRWTNTNYILCASQLAWNALLKNIDRPIPLITDPEIYRMIQPNIRGGICHASVRYAPANNKLMGSLYDQRQPTSYIMEIDANKLNG